MESGYNALDFKVYPFLIFSGGECFNANSSVRNDDELGPVNSCGPISSTLVKLVSSAPITGEEGLKKPPSGIFSWTMEALRDPGVDDAADEADLPRS